MISYPLALPSVTGLASRELEPKTVVGMVTSPFTGEQQVFGWPGQWLVFNMGLPPMLEQNAAIWASFFMSLNGPEGTFLLGDSVRKTSRGTVGGVWTVGAGAVANSTTLPVTGGTGLLAVGGWIQIFASGSTAKLHRVLQVNLSAGNMVSVDVFPRLRSAYANGSALTYANAKGVFRLAQMPPEAFDAAKVCNGMSFVAVEAL
jgi:hypothetical protein